MNFVAFSVSFFHFLFFPPPLIFAFFSYTEFIYIFLINYILEHTCSKHHIGHGIDRLPGVKTFQAGERPKDKVI
jgi:hypothetical protein